MSELTNILRRVGSPTSRFGGRWSGVAVSVLAGLIAGCGDQSGTTQPAPVVGAPGPIIGAPGPQAIAASCAGADLSGLKSQVFVKANGTDGPSCGTTTANACKTIQQGINNCAVGGCGVLVRHGLYPTTATITLRDSVSVYGSCRFDGEADHKYRTMIRASPAPGTPTISAVAINTPTTVYGVVVVAKDETANGTASIAMAVADSKGLTLSRSVLAGGKGGDGAAAAPPPAPGGGGGGGPATGKFSAGGGGGACPSSNAGAGGRGAFSNILFTVHHFFDATCSNTNAGGTGPNGNNGGDAGSVNGGAGGQPGTAGCDCSGAPNFQAGSAPQAPSGNEGSCAAAGGTVSAGAIWGSLASVVWTPTQSGSGATAGGGGGGGYSANGLYNEFDYSGYAGGGGGGGGCGGAGGGGGQQGGASFALVLSAASVTNNGSALIPGPGGRGGTGGAGAQGGPGGAGQGGWPGFDQGQSACISNGNSTPAPGSGGLGGNGGPGGSGSGGAAGQGGPSVGIALVAAAPAPATSGIYAPLPGAPGRNGSGAQNPVTGANPGPCKAPDGGPGSQGGGALTINFDLPLASTLFPGHQLDKGRSISSPNGKVALVMRFDDNFCLYSSGNYLWCTQSVGDGIPAAIMQTDGNLCLYPTNGNAPICSGTAGHPGAYLIVQDDGHIQIIDGGTVLWTRP